MNIGGGEGGGREEDTQTGLSEFQAVQAFISVTESSRLEAQTFLQDAKYNVDDAVGAFFAREASLSLGFPAGQDMGRTNEHTDADDFFFDPSTMARSATPAGASYDANGSAGVQDGARDQGDKPQHPSKRQKTAHMKGTGPMSSAGAGDSAGGNSRVRASKRNHEHNGTNVAGNGKKQKFKPPQQRVTTSSSSAARSPKGQLYVVVALTFQTTDAINGAHFYRAEILHQVVEYLEDLRLTNHMTASDLAKSVHQQVRADLRNLEISQEDEAEWTFVSPPDRNGSRDVEYCCANDDVLVPNLVDDYAVNIRHSLDAKGLDKYIWLVRADPDHRADSVVVLYSRSCRIRHADRPVLAASSKFTNTDEIAWALDAECMHMLQRERELS